MKLRICKTAIFIPFIDFSRSQLGLPFRGQYKLESYLRIQSEPQGKLSVFVIKSQSVIAV
jgi:hypothetical protein